MTSLGRRWRQLRWPPRQAWRFTVRTTASSLVALLVAEAFRLDSPQWAAMTVWIVAQPTRGMAVAKGLWRLVGTGVGAVAAAGLLLLTPMPPLFVVGLALWVAACCVTASVLRALRAYAAVLAGITGALLALLAFSHPEDILAVGNARIACVIVGIVVSTVTSLLFLPAVDRDQVVRRSRSLGADALAWASATLRKGRSGALVLQERQLVVEAAALVAAGDEMASGSARMQVRMPHVRAAITSVLGLMAAIRAVAGHRYRHGLPAADPAIESAAARLARAATAVREGGASEAFPIDALAVDRPSRHHLESAGVAVADLQRDLDAIAGSKTAPPTAQLRRHREWGLARITGLRSWIAVASVGAIWLVTGWEGGSSMLLGTSLMSCVFSTHDEPAVAIRGSVLGAVLAVGAVMLVRAVLLPGATSTVVLTLALVPFILTGGLAMAHPTTKFAGTEFNMLFLLLVQPALGTVGPPGPLFVQGVGTALGFAAAMLAFRFVLPTDPQRRLARLIRDMVADLEELARAPVMPAPDLWRARAGGRVLRLALRIGKVSQGRMDLLHGGLAAWTIGLALLRLRAAAALGPDVAEAVDDARGALGSLSMDPAGTTARVRAAAMRAQRAGAEEPAAALDEIADALESARVFFAAAA